MFRNSFLQKFTMFFQRFGSVIFPIFPKTSKNGVQLEFQKSRKTHSDSKPDSNALLKVPNAGPYIFHIFILRLMSHTVFLHTLIR